MHYFHPNPEVAPPRPLEEATYHFNSNPTFSRQLVDDLIWKEMEEDLIPSVLVDVLEENDDLENNQKELEPDLVCGGIIY